MKKIIKITMLCCLFICFSKAYGTTSLHAEFLPGNISDKFELRDVWLDIKCTTFADCDEISLPAGGYPAFVHFRIQSKEPVDKKAHNTDLISDIGKVKIYKSGTRIVLKSSTAMLQGIESEAFTNQSIPVKEVADKKVHKSKIEYARRHQGATRRVVRRQNRATRSGYTYEPVADENLVYLIYEFKIPIRYIYNPYYDSGLSTEDMYPWVVSLLKEKKVYIEVTLKNSDITEIGTLKIYARESSS